mgnify:CR=1 FL=1
MGKILAVDDEEEMLELVKMALERDGHQVDTEEDVKRVSAERCRIYDLLLLDVMMPGEDGFHSVAESGQKWIVQSYF